MHIKEAEYGSILYQCPKGSDQSKKQGDVQSDKKAADLFWLGGTNRGTVIFLMKTVMKTNTAVMGMMVIMMPFFFLAMYEKTDSRWKSFWNT